MASACLSGRGPFPFLAVMTTTPRSITISEPRINDRIRVPEVRLIGPGGEQVGVVATGVALKLAQDADLDLVEVAPDARPPVAKLMDFGKFKYETDMKAREARRKQANTLLKEIRFRLKIDPHDYETKKGHVVRFLSAGDKVKVMIMFRGREQSRPEMGVRLLQRLADDVAELGFVESMPKQDGRNMTMVLGPVKKKADAKVEQRKRSAEVIAQRKTKSEVKAEARAQAAGESAPTDSVTEPVPDSAVEAPVEPEVEAPVEAVEPEAATEVPAEPAVEAAPAKPAVEAAPAKPAVEAAPAKPAVEAAPAKPAVEAAPAKPAAKAAPVKTPAKPAAKAAPAKPAAKDTAAPAPAPRPRTPRPAPRPGPRQG
jgi:translation initiation factor IF-3